MHTVPSTSHRTIHCTHQAQRPHRDERHVRLRVRRPQQVGHDRESAQPRPHAQRRPRQQGRDPAQHGAVVKYGLNTSSRLGAQHKSNSAATTWCVPVPSGAAGY
eukprot:scaffold24666_cov62-Phaeocystis_antarctica.AAC.6